MPLFDHQASLTAFANSHFKSEKDHDYHIKLKFEHSLRVCENAKAIVADEDITGHVASLATLAALFHDIGRFPQYTTYGTFKDAESINHGRLGVLTLRDQKLPHATSKKDLRLIRAAIGLHNVKAIRDTTPQPLATIANIVRDADKIDIFSVILDHLDPETESKPVVIHSLIQDQTKYSDEVYQTTLAGEIGDYSLLRYSNDFILLLIGWLFVLHYPTSVRLIAERGLIEQAFSILPKDDKIQTLNEKSHTFMRYKNTRTP
ncbi:HD family phosphohydrolase [Pseudodesulfovibrio nedwellii]|uniref:HD family phosphohydrolase n=1 Tax=Pseudodesulfovibrio nedwellii TaxID=2973072 RepID=A0ABM8AYD2_9BACT|nr:HD domain-containing protein [Pseudodesulfovibrio nedwellii]BDQ36489.1 HD family phosphohydrolase [Pseudodesulfovibrio nedwellii]